MCLAKATWKQDEKETAVSVKCLDQNTINEQNTLTERVNRQTEKGKGENRPSRLESFHSN